MKRSNLGISLIAGISIFAVVMVARSEMVENTLFARFALEHSEFNSAVTNNYFNKKMEYVLAGKYKTDNQIYYTIASGKEVDELPVATGTVDGLGVNIYPEILPGKEFYEITSDTNVENWKKENKYYTETEKHYLTDEGVAFILPGYLKEDDEGIKKWWINESMYYISDTPITQINASNII